MKPVRIVENLLFFFLLLFFLAAPSSVAYSEIGIGVVVLLGAVRLAIRGGPVYPRRAPGLFALAPPVLAYTAAYALSALFGREPEPSFEKLLKLLPMALAFLLPSLLWNGKRLRHAAAALILGGVITSAYGIGYWINDPSTRLGGFVGFYMSTAGILMMICLVASALLFTRRLGGVLRPIAALSLPVLLAALYLTDTRGAWLGLMAGLFVLAGLYDRRLVLVPLLLAASLAVMPGKARETALSAFDPNHPRNRERTLMWKAGWRIFLDHPLTGVGPAGMDEVYLEYRDPAAEEAAKHLHSVPVHILASLGIIGFTAWAWLFGALPVWIHRRGAEARRRGPPVARGLVMAGLAVWAGFVVNGLVEWNLGDVEVVTLFWAVIGLATASIAASPGDEEEPAGGA